MALPANGIIQTGATKTTPGVNSTFFSWTNISQGDLDNLRRGKLLYHMVLSRDGTYPQTGYIYPKDRYRYHLFPFPNSLANDAYRSHPSASLAQINDYLCQVLQTDRQAADRSFNITTLEVAAVVATVGYAVYALPEAGAVAAAAPAELDVAGVGTDTALNAAEITTIGTAVAPGGLASVGGTMLTTTETAVAAKGVQTISSAISPPKAPTVPAPAPVAPAVSSSSISPLWLGLGLLAAKFILFT